MKNNLFERFVNYLFGYERVTVVGYTPRVLTALLRSELDYRDLQSAPDGISITVSYSDRRRLERILSRIDCEIQVDKVDGAVHFLLGYRARPGIIAGLFAFSLILAASTLFVWDVTVSGNESISDRTVIESFEKYGVCCGAFIPSLDLDTICHEYLIDSNDIAWASVNMNGTCANIVVMERDAPDEKIDMSFASDIVASEDGQIERFAVKSGKVCIHIGDVVRAGDLLVSGKNEIVHNDEVTNTVFSRSLGSVRAQVYREYTECVPLSESVKEYTGVEKTRKDYTFFANPAKSFEKSIKNKEFYDTIIDNEKVILFGFIKLPVFECRTVMREYTEKEVRYTEEQARKIAEARMLRRLSDELRGCELLSVKTDGGLDGDRYMLKCRVYCIAEIAKEVEMSYGTEDDTSR